MRILWLIGSLVLVSACSSYSVRCSKHLRPINSPVPRAAAVSPHVPGSPGSGSTSTPAAASSGRP